MFRQKPCNTDCQKVLTQIKNVKLLVYRKKQQLCYFFYTKMVKSVINSSAGGFRTQSNIYDGVFWGKHFNFYCKRAPSYTFDWILNTPLSSTSFFKSIYSCLSYTHKEKLCFTQFNARIY